MGATNHTANYDLPQWIGTDKPTFLGDMNDAFLKIDTQMKANADSVGTAVSTAGSAQSAATAASQSASEALQAANTAGTNATQALNTANNAASTANTAQTTAEAASTAATQAQGTANSANNRINNLKFPTGVKITSFLPSNATGEVTMSYNPELNLYNMYGFVMTNNGVNFPSNTKLFNVQGLPSNPTSDREIFGLSFIVESGRGSAFINKDGSFSVRTDAGTGVQFVGFTVILNCAGWFD